MSDDLDELRRALRVYALLASGATMSQIVLATGYPPETIEELMLALPPPLSGRSQ